MRAYVGARRAHRLFIVCAAGVAALVFGAASAAAFFHASSPKVVARSFVSPRINCASGFSDPQFPNRSYTGVGCAYNVQPHEYKTTPSTSYTLSSLQVTVEDLITVDAGVTLTIPANTPVALTHPGAGYGSFDIQGTAAHAGTLVVQSGVTLTFTSDAQGIITVENHGFLDMSAGIPAAPIVATNSSTTPGGWEGFLFLTGSNGSLNNVKVWYAGASYSGCSTTITAAIYTCGAAPSITNSSIRYSSANAVEVNNTVAANGGVSPTLTSDLISDNLSGWGLTYDQLPASLDVVTNLTIVHNKYNTVFLEGGTWQAGALAPSHVLHDVGAYGYPAAITVDGNLTVSSQDTLVVGAGTILDFSSGGPGAGITGGILTINGTLDMSAATATQPDVLTDSTGVWGGLVFTKVGGITPQGTLNNVSEQFAATGISITGATPSISNTSIDQSVNDAIDVYNADGSTPTLTTVILTNSGGNPLAYLSSPPNTLSLVTGLTIFGNGDNRIKIVPNGHAQSGAGNWANYGVPYDIEGNLTVQGNLTVGSGTQITPMNGNLSVPTGGSFSTGQGTTIAFTPGIAAVFSIGGSLTLTGVDDTTSGRVTLTSYMSTTPGDWAGLQTRGASVTLTHVRVEYAGHTTADSTPAYCCLDSNAHTTGIYVLNSTPTIQNTTVTNSGGNGIEVNNFDGTTPTLTNDTITNNGGYALFYDYLANDLSPLSGLTITGNTYNRIYLAGGYQTGTGTWPNFGAGVTYEIGGNAFILGTLTLAPNVTISPLTGDLNIHSGGTLIAGAGVTIKFAAGSAHTLDSNGTLDLSGGTSAHPITLTSTSGSQGTWGGVQVYGSATLTYVDILGAGANVGGVGQFGLFVGSGGSAAVTYSLISSSGGDDVRIVDGSNSSFEHNDFELVGSGFYGMINFDSGHTVDATYNFWGDPSGPKHPTLNPLGTGAPVSDYINFSPWVGVPQVVTNLQATTGSKQVTVTWNAPSYDGGSPITGYDVLITLQGGGSAGLPTYSAGCATGGTCTIGNLANGTAYKVHVQADNTYGDGPDSTVNITTLPGVPTNLVATHGDTKATITWSPPSDAGSEVTITGYTLTVTRDSDSSIVYTNTVGSASCGSSCVVTGLTNGTLYDVSVQAVNSAGTGAAAATTVTPSTKPGGVTNLTYTAGNGSVTLNWTAPDNGGAPLMNYSVDCGGHPASPTPPGTATSATVPGLTNGTSYTCSVTANNLNGSGATVTINNVQPNPAPVITIVGGSPQNAEYSDTTSITVNGPDSDGDAVTMTVSANCGAGGGFSCLPNGLTATVTNGAVNPHVSISGADTSPAGDYTVHFTANDGYSTTQKDLTIHVTPEPAYLTIPAHAALVPTAAGGNSGTFFLGANVKDTSSDTTGNLAKAGPLAVTLTPIGSFGTAAACNAAVQVNASGGNGSCSFSNIQPGTYLITVAAQGDYYSGNDHGIVTVVDKSKSVVAGTEDVTVSATKYEAGFLATNSGGLKGGMAFIKFGTATVSGGTVHADTVLTSTSLTSLTASQSSRTMTLQGNAKVGANPPSAFTLSIPSVNHLSMTSSVATFGSTQITGGSVFITNQ